MGNDEQVVAVLHITSTVSLLLDTVHLEMISSVGKHCVEFSATAVPLVVGSNTVRLHAVVCSPNTDSATAR